MLRRTGGIADLSVGIVLINQILHHRPALKNTLRAIQNRRDTAVWVDLQEPPLRRFLSAKYHKSTDDEGWIILLFLSIGADINPFNLVG